MQDLIFEVQPSNSERMLTYVYHIRPGWIHSWENRLNSQTNLLTILRSVDFLVKMNTLSRTYSDSFVTGMGDYDLFKNKNTDWMNGKYTKLVYVLFVLAFWFLVHISTIFTIEDSWTITNIVHLVVSETLYFLICS